MVHAARSGAAPRREVVVRPRLLERLQRRFDVRLTVLTGGAGSGKTTLLAQAMSAAHDDVDVWVPCEATDRDPDRLVSHIADEVAHRLGAPSTADAPTLDQVAEAILGASPRQVCIVLDDVHRLGRGAGIDELLRALPGNGHVLLSSRYRPDVDTARLDAAGELEEIEQDELLLTADEVIEFANLRGVDVAVLQDAGGWPAFVELASTGSASRSQRYLDEQALRDIDTGRRSGLAAFAFVGGGDDEVARAVAGRTLEELVADLPLVRWSGDTAQLHELWDDLLASELDEAHRHRAAIAAAEIARRRREVDRAIDLAATVGDWDDVQSSLRRAFRDGVEGGLRADQLRRWRSVLPAELHDTPIAILLDGLHEREIDPTSPAAFELLDRAAAAFADAGEHDLELAALAQLGYLARVVHTTAVVEDVAARFERLAEVYPPARPFVAIGVAWAALTTGQQQRQLDALLGIEDDALPPVWQVTRRHLIAHALFNLGRAEEGLGVVPRDIDTLPVPIPGALVTESQCRWYAGHPEEALAAPPRGASHRHGARDRFIAAAWEAAMRALAGDAAGARVAATRAADSTGANPGPLVRGQMEGLEVLSDVAAGNEERAAARLRAILAEHPFGAGLSDHMFRMFFVYPYVLAEESRAFWDDAPMPTRRDEVRRLVRAFVAARSDDLGPLTRVRWPEPGTIAAFVPSPWAVELAVRGASAGRHEAQRLAAWLLEHWREPARREFDGWLTDDRLGHAARQLLASTPSPPAATVRLDVLGHTEVIVDGHPTDDPDWRRERVRALLVWLVLHPTGSRVQAATALWPDLTPDRAAKNLRTTLNYVHGVLEPDRASGDAPWFVRSDGQRLELLAGLDVDLRRFRSLLDRAEAAEIEGHPRDALALFEEAISLWRGDLASDLDHDWLDLERIHVRSRFVRAACRATELLVATGHAERAIVAARLALDADPYHTPTYQALAEAYVSVGDATSARQILARAADLLELTSP